MVSKYQLITAMYEEICKEVARDRESWKEFLTTAGSNYKLRFDEQLLIYVQRPDATAVLEIEKWNNSFHRWVNKGAKGIAVFNEQYAGRQRLKYYFDVSDTHEGRNPRTVPIWNMKPEYEEDVIGALEGVYGELNNKSSLQSAIISAAENGAEDNMGDYFRELLDSKTGSYLEDLDEDNLIVRFRETVAESVSYLIGKRLGESSEADLYEFQWLSDFNTKETLEVLGHAVSDISEMGLREVTNAMINGQENIKAPVFSSPKQKERKLLLSDRSPNNNTIIKYLFDRGIDLEIIRFCLKERLIYESLPYHNVIFLGKDNDGTPKYAAYRATNGSKILGDATGSDKRYSFRIMGGDSESVHVFESAIDLLSYATLLKKADINWRSANLLSLAGVYGTRLDGTSKVPAALQKCLDEDKKVKTIYLHLDNDKAGRLATNGLKDALKDHMKVVDEPPPYGKDFNDYLQRVNEKEMRKNRERRAYYER